VCFTIIRALYFNGAAHGIHQHFQDRPAIGAARIGATLSLEREKTTDRGVDPFVPIPALHAPVRVNNLGKQFVHPMSPSKRLRALLTQN
jgi:hypothetical protein